MTTQTVQVSLQTLQDYVDLLSAKRFSDNDEGDYYDRQNQKKIKDLCQIQFTNKLAIIPASIIRGYIAELNNQRFSDNDEGDYYYNIRNRKVQQLNALLVAQ